MTTVVYLENALTPHLREVVSASGSIRELAPVDWSVPFVAFVDGRPVLRADWELVLEDEQTLAFIEVGALPQGGGGGGSDPLRTILLLAVIVYAPYLATEFLVSGGLGLAEVGMTMAMGTAITQMAGIALVNALIPPPKPTTPQQAASLAAASPTYSLQAQGNMARLDAAIPEHFGRMLAYPDFAAKPYSEFAGNEQYVYMLLCVGRGHYDIEAYRIEDTPMANFDDIVKEVVPPGGSLTLFPANVVTNDSVAGQELDCFAATYSQTGTVITVSKTGHGQANGSSVYLGVSSGGATSGTYTIASVPTPDTFTVTAGSSATISGSLSVSPWAGGFIASASGENANYLGVDIVAPRGLFYAGDNGSLSAMSAYLEMDVRTVDAVGAPTSGWVTKTNGVTYSAWGAWTYHPGAGPGSAANSATVEFTDTTYDGIDGTYYYLSRSRVSYVGTALSGATTTPQRVSWRYAVTPGRYEVRMRRTDVVSTEGRAGHATAWAGLRAYMPDTRVYGDVTLLALRMRASNNLSSQASRKVNVIATRKLPVWNGSTWGPLAPTRSPSWALAYACKQMGMTDAQIDLAGLLTLANTASSRGDYFDARFDNFLSFWEAISKIAGSVRAKPFMQGGVLRVIRDQAASLPVALFSGRNIVKGSFAVTYLMPTPETADAVDVKYFDDTKWAQATVRAKLPGSVAATPAKVDLFGVTGRAQAYREGLYQAAANRYRRKVIKFQTEMEGFIPSFGDLIAIQHDMPAWGQGGEVVAWDSVGKVLTLSEEPVWGTGTHYIGLRKRDGSVDGPFAVTLGAAANKVVLAVAPSFTPYTGGAEERTHYTFGWMNTWRQPARVLTARPQNDHIVEIEAVGEDDNVHTADVGVTTPVQATSQLAGYTNAPNVTGLSARPVPFSQTKMSISWAPSPWAERYYAEQSLDGGQTWTRMGEVQTNNVVIEVQNITTKVRVAALGLAKGPWSELAIVIPPPPPFDVFIVMAQPDGTRQYNFGYSSLVEQPFNWKGAEIRYTSGTVPSPDWDSMTPLQDSTTFYTHSPVELNAPLSGTYTFACRSTDLLNQASTLSVRTVTLPDRRLGNVFDEFFEHTEGWTGTKTSCAVVGTGLEALDSTTWDGLPSTWDTWSRWNLNPASPISYTTPVRDFGTAISGQINSTIDADGTVVQEIATSADGTTWSAWGSAAAPFSSRYLKVRVTVTATGTFPVPAVRTWSYQINAPMRREDINDLVISTLTGSYRIGVGDIRIPLAGVYSVIKRTTATIQDTRAGSWTATRYDQSLSPAPRWQFKLNGTLTDPQFVDFLVEGY